MAAEPFLIFTPTEPPNVVPGLTSALSTALGREVSDGDVLAYIAALVAHPAYTLTFADELTTPGIRVPITTDPELWSEAVKLGERVIWLHTYGASFTGPDRSRNNVRLPAGNPCQPLSIKPIPPCRNRSPTTRHAPLS